MQRFSSLLSWRLFTAQHASGVFPPIIRSLMTAVAASGLTFVTWWQSCCVRGRADRPARPRTQHVCHHDTNVKPEAATAVIKILMMGGKTPETYWAVNKRQDNKLENHCIGLVIYLNCTMMHGLTNLKFWFHLRTVKFLCKFVSNIMVCLQSKPVRYKHDAQKTRVVVIHVCFCVSCLPPLQRRQT
jgi:hypothetical protein